MGVRDTKRVFQFNQNFRRQGWAFEVRSRRRFLFLLIQQHFISIPFSWSQYWKINLLYIAKGYINTHRSVVDNIDATYIFEVVLLDFVKILHNFVSQRLVKYVVFFTAPVRKTGGWDNNTNVSRGNYLYYNYDILSPESLFLSILAHN